jgi:D-aspartate ligase
MLLNPEVRAAPLRRQAGLSLDTRVPALVFKTGRNLAHHGTVGIIRSLGRLGVPVYAAVEDSFTPAAASRYLAGYCPWKGFEPGAESLIERLLAIGRQLGRPAALVPTDDLAAALVAEHAAALDPWFLFPRPPAELPRRLANKRSLHDLCVRLDVPVPQIASPASWDEVHAFIGRASFPVMVKAADSSWMAHGARSAALVRTPAELLTLYRRVVAPERCNLLLQEYIPPASAEDWVVHGYANPQSGCLVTFTGRKLRSYPPFAGPTSLGVSVPNGALEEQARKLLRAIGYAGIFDLDYRFDKRDGQYKLLDFNPRIGANFRMFESGAAVDVVRALHLDLTGRSVPEAPPLESRKFIVESQDWFASLGYARHGELTFRGWLESVQGRREYAWACADDPLPALVMGFRLLSRTTRRVLAAGWGRIAGRALRWKAPPFEHAAAACAAKLTVDYAREGWGGRRDSNPRPPEPQSGALPS